MQRQILNPSAMKRPPPSLPNFRSFLVNRLPLSLTSKKFLITDIRRWKNRTRQNKEHAFPKKKSEIRIFLWLYRTYLPLTYLDLWMRKEDLIFNPSNRKVMVGQTCNFEKKKRSFIRRSKKYSKKIHWNMGKFLLDHNKRKKGEPL